MKVVTFTATVTEKTSTVILGSVFEPVPKLLRLTFAGMTGIDNASTIDIDNIIVEYESDDKLCINSFIHNNQESFDLHLMV